MVTYQNEITNLLTTYFSSIVLTPEPNVQKEWPAFPRDKRYSPRIDIAVGPFAVENNYTLEYDRLCLETRNFLDLCFNVFENNIRDFKPGISGFEYNYKTFNKNARCFIAIEIEKTGTRKHRLGDIVNASSLGRIGLIIAWDASVLKSFLRIIEYFNFLEDVGKNTFITKNIAVIEREQFRDILIRMNKNR